MNISVKTPEDEVLNFTIDNTWTCSKLKEKIEELIKIPKLKQSLFCNSRLLKNRVPLVEQDVGNGSTINLSIREKRLKGNNKMTEKDSEQSQRTEEKIQEEVTKEEVIIETKVEEAKEIKEEEKEIKKEENEIKKEENEIKKEENEIKEVKIKKKEKRKGRGNKKRENKNEGTKKEEAKNEETQIKEAKKGEETKIEKKNEQEEGEEDYRAIGQGINVFGICEKDDCKAYKKEVCYCVEGDEFYLIEEKGENKNEKVVCPLCGSIIKPTLVGFYMCKYKASGKRIIGDETRAIGPIEEESNDENNMLYFQEKPYNTVKFSKIQFEVIERYNISEIKG